jgi:HEAT repeat protein
VASVNLSKEEILKNLNSVDIDCTLRNNAIIAAGEFCDAEITAAVEKLCTAPDPATRYFAKKTIKKIKDAQQKSESDPAAAPLVQSANSDTIKNLLASQNPENRQRAMKALTASFNPAVLPQMIEMLKSEKDPFVIASLVKLVGKYGGAAHVEALSVFLEHEDPRVRANTIEGLELTGSEKIIAYIVPFINDVDNRIKANAVKALSKFKSDEMLEVLGSMIKSEHLWMRDSALFALQQIASDPAVDLLCIAAQDAEKSIANNAMQALIRIGSVYALKKVDELRQTLKEKSSVPLIKKILNASDGAAAADKNVPAPPQDENVKPQGDVLAPEPEVSATLPSQQAEDETVQPAGAPAGQQRAHQAAKSGKSEGAFEKLKANIDKKETALINIFKDDDSLIMSKFKIDLEDNFTGYATEINYVALAVAAAVAEKKKSASEKTDAEEDILPGAALKPASTEGAARMQNEAKKKMLLDSLRGTKSKK